MQAHYHYIDKKIASALLYNNVGNFELSAHPKLIPNEKVIYLRLALLGLVTLSLVIHYLGVTGSVIVCLFTSIEYYAIISCILALYTSHKAS